ncbi:MAG: DUF11 domain-containing protein [Candidatus Delongbacteria bacterium]|nr:DUF11 domain-containing protein [Candidatus Delongbacteria bacterium]
MVEINFIKKLLKKNRFKSQRLKKILKVIKFTSILLFLLSSFKTISYADSFYPTGDNAQCRFASTVGVGYDQLGGGGINWNPSDVQGYSRDWLSGARFTDVATPYAPNAHRYPGVADYVAVPPNTRVSVAVWAWNYSGHSINVPSVHLFLSKHNQGGGMTNLGASGSYASTCWNTGGDTICRNGMRQVSGNIGSYADRGNETGRFIYEFNTIQPITSLGMTAVPVWSGVNLNIRYDLRLRNNSSYNLCNIRVRDVMPSGQIYDQTHCINAGQTATISYQEAWGTAYPMTITNDGATVFDNNRLRESTAEAMSWYGDNRPETKTAVAFRDDQGASGWSAGQESWGMENGELFTVELIPYNFASAGTTLNLQQNVNITKTVTDIDEINVVHNTAQNREELIYNVTVTNNEARATNMTVVDDYDQNYLTILDSNGGLDDGNRITWTTNLEHGESKSFTIKAKLINLEQGDYTFINRAWTENPVETPVETITDVKPRVILTLSKTVTDSDESNVKVNSIQGDHFNSDERKIHFDINYSNIGDAIAHNVVLTDDLSEFANNNEIQSVENISNGGTFDPNTFIVTWNIGDINYKESGLQSFDLVLSRIADNDRNIINTTTIISDQTQPISDTTTTNILTPEVTVSKTDNKETAESNESLTYVITVSNNGTGSAYNLKINDILPQYVINVQNIYDNGRFDAETRTIIWEDLINPEGIYLLSGESIAFTYEVTIPQIMPGGTTILINNVTVDSDTIEEVTAQDQTNVLAPILELIKVQNLPEIVSPGQPIIYTLNYRNSGTGKSPNTKIVDTLPEHTVFIEFVDSENQPNGVYNQQNNTITWDIGTVEPNESGSLSFKVVIEIPTPTNTEIRNTAVIYSPITDIVSSETLTATTSSCCMGGYVWDDKNKNGNFDENEKGIKNAQVILKWNESDYLPPDQVELLTEQNGHYEYNGLPYFVPITITIIKPASYSEITTQDEFKIVLLPPSPSGNEDYYKDGIHYITGGGTCINYINAGVFRESLLVRTGEIIIIPLAIGVFLLISSLLGIILLFIKRKKR